jgi:hypothetical protein
MRGNLVRRLLVICAVAVTVLAAFAALRANRVTTVSAAGTPGNLTLGGVPIAPGCPLGPSLTFCDQAPGTAQLEGTFGIGNPVAVMGVKLTQAAAPGLAANFPATCSTGGACDFTIIGNTCTGNLAANQGCVIGLDFTPTALGLRAAALTVTDTEGDTVSVIVEGTGKNLALGSPVPPACAQQPPIDNSFPFCQEAVGASGTAEAFTLTAGAAETGITWSLAAIPGLAPEFAAGDFTIGSTSCTGVLTALATCNINVAFSPTTAGLRSAALTATDSNGDVTTIFVSGNTTSGVQVGAPVTLPTPAHCPLVNIFQFCNEPTSGTTPTMGLRVVNTSGTQLTGLTITPAVLNGLTNPPPPPVNFTVLSTSCASTLAANSSCTINVAFTPQATGLQQGSVTVTDTQGDVAAFNLSGVGDDFSMVIVAGQSQEVSVAQGDTATFKAQLNDDGVFGQNGETVSLACPVELPAFTNCSYTPCPITPVLNGNVPFSILIATSTNAKAAPEIPNPCDSAGAANVAPGSRGPIGILRIVANQPNRVSQFPALLVILILITLTTSVLGLGAMGALPKFPLGARRAMMAFALIALSGALLTACKKKSSTTPSTATPIAVTNMNVLASALDSNGLPISAGRELQITLDVIKGP